MSMNEFRRLAVREVPSRYADHDHELFVGSLMPTRVALDAHFEAFIEAQFATGRYNHVSEIVCEGLRLLEDRESLRTLKVAQVHATLQAGLDRGPATPLDLEEIRAERRRPFELTCVSMTDHV